MIGKTMRYFLLHIVIVEFRRCCVVLYKKNIFRFPVKIYMSAYARVFVCNRVYVRVYIVSVPVYRERWLRLKCDEIIESLYCHTPCLASGVSFIRYIILDTVTNAFILSVPWGSRREPL